jgi:hypothetical protein
VSDAQIFFWSLSAGRTTFFLTGHFLCWARIFFSFYLLPLSGRFLQGSAASGHFPPAARAVYFFACRHALSDHFPPAARTVYFFFACRHAISLSGQQLCMQKLFPLSRHFPGAQTIFFACCRSAGQQDLCAPEFFFVESGLVCMQNLFLCACRVRSLPLCLGAQIIFFIFLSGHLSSTGRAQHFS